MLALAVPLLRDCLLALVATLGFAVLFNVPRRTLGACALLGSIAFVIKRSLQASGSSDEWATLVAALGLGLLGEIAARWQRAPAALFFVTGFVPLVPGVLAYRSVLLFLEGQYSEAITSGVRATLLAGAIAGGLGVMTALFRLSERWKSKQAPANFPRSSNQESEESSW